MFVSYAQNFEDVMLWRALKDVECGFYIDIGAQHPIVDSVSKAFYEHGWRGVHVEPVPEFADLLRMDRPDEEVLQLALGLDTDILTLYSIPGTGLSTLSKHIADCHRERHGYQPCAVSVPVVPARLAFSSLVRKEIHWAKIDVEGSETAVLSGWDFATLRPWIIVVEATLPLSQEETFSEWEPILLQNSYSLVYRDGLNRFYVAAERHSSLAPAFTFPPNVFDGVALSGTSSGPWTRNANDLLEKYETRAATAENLAEVRARALQEAHQNAELVLAASNEATRKAEMRAIATEALLEDRTKELLDAHELATLTKTAFNNIEQRFLEQERDSHALRKEAIDLREKNVSALRTIAYLEGKVEQLEMQLTNIARLAEVAQTLTADLQRQNSVLIKENVTLEFKVDQSAQIIKSFEEKSIRSEQQITALTNANGESSVRIRDAEEALDKSIRRLAELESELNESKGRLEEANHNLEDCRKEQKDLYRSRSWRITAPLRRANALANHVRTSLHRQIIWLLLFPRKSVARILIYIYEHLQAHPSQKNLARRTISHLPTLDQGLRKFVRSSQQVQALQQVQAAEPSNCKTLNESRDQDREPQNDLRLNCEPLSVRRTFLEINKARTVRPGN